MSCYSVILFVFVMTLFPVSWHVLDFYWFLRASCMYFWRQFSL